MSADTISYEESARFLKEKNIKISTITMDCKMQSEIDIERLALTVRLHTKGILSITYGERGDIATNRSIIKRRASKRSFYNQATVLVKPDARPDDVIPIEKRNPINIKIFRNGSLQMTGCKDIRDFYSVTHKLVRILKHGHRPDRHGPRVSYAKNVHRIGIYDVHIRMINSNFKIGHQINREMLSRVLVRKHGYYSLDPQWGYIEHKYDPVNGHSCVNIKHRYENDRVSVFVFQTGSIIITGAKSFPQIISAYHFIMALLERYHYWVVVRPVDRDQILSEISRFAEQRRRRQRQERRRPQISVDSQEGGVTPRHLRSRA